MNKIKEHLKRHKTLYISIGTGVLVATGTPLIMRSIPSSIERSANMLAQRSANMLGKRIEGNALSSFSQEKTLMINSNINLQQTIEANRQGPPSWVVRCLETDKVFVSQKSAADLMGLSKSDLSRHLNGMREHVNGYHFERICLAA